MDDFYQKLILFSLLFLLGFTVSSSTIAIFKMNEIMKSVQVIQQQVTMPVED